jgi:hypothetical protein
VSDFELASEYAAGSFDVIHIDGGIIFENPKDTDNIWRAVAPGRGKPARLRSGSAARDPRVSGGAVHGRGDPFGRAHDLLVGGVDGGGTAGARHEPDVHHRRRDAVARTSRATRSYLADDAERLEYRGWCGRATG